jgi:Rps23 Pro-64 3,4-dihydroxylase Tpa1-like proline 4-hydroxylase
MIRDIDWYKLGNTFLTAEPFNHVVIDNFFMPEVAEKLVDEFIDFNAPHINEYNSGLEIKKSLNHWDKFPPTTYRAFSLFGRSEFIDKMRIMSGIEDLWFDFGLNGGGWHMHSRGGNNNVHLDYNLHPKLGLQRKLNIIIYMTPGWQSEWGGGLELWSHDEETNNPKEKVKTVDNLFNRAIIFDTTQNSWHGLPNAIECPEDVIRRSLAAYFVQPAPAITEQRGRALFAARDDQKDNKEIENLIKLRASVEQSADAYRYNKN